MQNKKSTCAAYQDCVLPCLLTSRIQQTLEFRKQNVGCAQQGQSLGQFKSSQFTSSWASSQWPSLLCTECCKCFITVENGTEGCPRFLPFASRCPKLSPFLLQCVRACLRLPSGCHQNQQQTSLFCPCPLHLWNYQHHIRNPPRTKQISSQLEFED